MPQPDTVVLQVCAGMGNRLRALVSGLCLAEDLGVRLQIIWPANEPTCLAPFDKLFESSSLPSWASVSLGPLLKEPKMVLGPEDMAAYIDEAAWGPIKSYGRFHTSDEARWLAYLRALRPEASVLSRVPSSITPYVGVHIRRGDHRKSREFSPTEAFREAMKQEPETTQFVLATDDVVEARYMTETFGKHRVTVLTSSFSRMTLRGMQDAVLDFFVLSRGLKILGSFQSSFSEIAAQYGDIPLQVITRK